MRRTVGAVLTWSVAGASANMLAGILVARLLGPSDRGTLAVIVSIVGIGCVVSSLGTNVAIRSILPKSTGGTLLGSYLGLSVALSLLQTAVCSLLMYLSAGAVDSQLRHPAVLASGTAYAIGFLLSIQLFDAINAQGRASRAARLNAVGSGVQLVLVALTYRIGNLETVLVCFALATLVQIILSCLAIRRWSSDALPAVNRADWTRLLRTGIPAVGLNLGQVLTYRLDRYLVGLLAGPSAAGIYAIASTPAELLRLPSAALGQVSMHKLAAGEVSIDRVLKSILKMLGLVLIPGCALLIAADQVLHVVYGSDYESAATPLRYLVLAEILLLPFQVAGRSLAGLGLTKVTAVVGASGAIVSIGTLFLLVPGLGATGGALASITAYVTMSLMAVVFLRRTEPERQAS